MEIAPTPNPGILRQSREPVRRATIHDETRNRSPMTSRRAGAFAVTSALLCCVTALGAQQTGPVFKSGAAEISINGRVQTQFNTTDVRSEPSTEVALRRVRLEATVRINDVVSGKVQPEFAGSRVTLRDAYVRFTLDPALQLLAGQAHRPFSPLTMASSTRMLPVERGLRIRGVEGFDEFNLVSDLGYADRDVGLQLQGEPRNAPLGLRYAAGYFNGPLRDRVSQNNSQLAARVSVAPVSGVRVGAAWSSRDFVPFGSDDDPEAEVELERGNAWEVDLEVGAYDSPGLHFAGEVATGDFDPSVDARFFGAHGWLAYRTRALSERISGVEPLVRVSYGDPDAGGDAVDAPGFAAVGGTLVTPGVNVYFGGLNRIMLNYDFWSPLEGDSHGSFKAQFQLAF